MRCRGNTRNSPGRVLIYCIGSIGDTVVALPAFHLIAKAFPDAERRVLTNLPVTVKEAPIQSVLENSGLVHGYIPYPVGTRSVPELAALRRKIKRWSPDILVYLTQARGRLIAVRDAVYFKLCGIERLIGVPYTFDQQRPRQLDGVRHFESEARRLLRNLGTLGTVDLEDPANWTLSLTAEEMGAADRLLHGFGRQRSFIAASVGAKTDTKDWGQNKWMALLDQTSARHPELDLVLVGASDEHERCNELCSVWRGPALNLCGAASPRISAAVLKHALLYVGHDSGPMHLAASVGTPCVAIFSAQNLPGEWFPFGSRNRVIYHQTECFGCRLVVCHQHSKKCISSIAVDEVFSAISETLMARM